jgi:hypothetical protein
MWPFYPALRVGQGWGVKECPEAGERLTPPYSMDTKQDIFLCTVTFANSEEKIGSEDQTCHNTFGKLHTNNWYVAQQDLVHNL